MNYRKLKTYKIKCKDCGKTKFYDPKKAFNGKRKFCNYDCFVKYLRKNRFGKNNPNYKDKIKIKCKTCNKLFKIYPSQKSRRKFCNRDCWFSYLKNVRRISDLNRKKMLKSLLKRPTKPEKIIIDLIKKHNLPFKYVGNGSVILNGINPDFIECNGKKIIIEVFGNYWHKEGAKIFRQTEYGRRKIYSEVGYKVLILWENDIYKDVEETLNKIKNFIGE